MFQLNCGHEESWLYWLISVLWLLGGLFQGHCFVGERDRERVYKKEVCTGLQYLVLVIYGWVGREGGA